MSMALRLMPQTCAIYRASRASDGQGGWVASWALVASDVPCKYDPSSHMEEVVADKQRERHEGRLYVPLATDIVREDKVVLDDGRSLKVLSTEPPGGRSIGGAGGQTRVIIEELQPDAEQA